MSVRAQNLKEKVCIKAVKDVTRGYEKVEEGKAYRSEVKLCIERARLFTESYKETEGEPMIMRRAKALSKTLENMTIWIQDEELIVGGVASDPYSVISYPELYWSWLEKALDDGYRHLLNEKEKEELKEIHRFWQKRAVHGMERDLLPDDIRQYWRWNGAAYWTYNWDMALPDYERLLRVGLKGLFKEAEDRLEEIKTSRDIDAKEYVEQKRFLEAVRIALEAGIDFGERYAEKARELAKVEKDEKRRKELERIAEVCQRVPENPARSFHEALQSFFLVHLIANFIELPLIGLGVRLDQVMYPYYKKDIEQGNVTREEAQELIECLWVKFQEQGFLHPPMWSGVGGGGLAWQNVTIGGVTPKGEDATNELTYMILEATRSLQTIQPPLELRYHDKTPRELTLKAIDVMATGVAQPALFNDKVVIPLLLREGFSIEEARNYVISNCMFWTIPGKNMPYRAGIGFVMLTKCLELALNRGRDKFSGRQIGYPTADPSTFASIEDILEAYLQQYRFFCEKLVYISDIADALLEEHLPRPFLSALLNGCIQKGKDCTKSSEYPRRPLLITGAVNVADSLAAIKKIVFDEKRATLGELLQATRDNFDGKEDLRQMVLSAPKFGNDDDYVDSIAREVFYRTTEETGKFRTYGGLPLCLDGTIAATGYSFAIDTGATPDGRKDREPYHDGTISPVQGRDKNGPTAVLKSVSKIDPLLSHNHLFNQRFSPEFLTGANKGVFADYLKTWSDLGIHHIQFNVIDAAVLRDAQQHPEKYANLIVRVCGYAAYFVDLSKGLQDDIIRRTEQRFG